MILLYFLLEREKQPAVAVCLVVANKPKMERTRETWQVQIVPRRRKILYEDAVLKIENNFEKVLVS